MVAGRFQDQEFRAVQGYRISACLDVPAGFGGKFFVYVFVRIDAVERFRYPLELHDPGNGC